MRNKEPIDGEKVDYGFHQIRGNYFRAWLEKRVTSRSRNWQPPLGRHGQNGRGSFTAKFKGNVGRFLVSRPSKIKSTCQMLGLIPKEWTDRNGFPGDQYVIRGGWINSTEEFYNYYNIKRAERIHKPNFLPFTLHKDKLNGLRLPYVPIKPTKDCVYGVTLTADTSCGVIASQVMQHNKESYSPLGGGYRKGSFAATAARCLVDAWDEIHSGKYNTMAGVYCVGGRSKAKGVKFSPESLIGSTKLSSRPVHSPELFHVLMDSVYYQWFNRMGSTSLKGKSQLGLGHSMTNLGFHRLEDDAANGYVYELEADWSGFDVRVPIFLIEEAFVIIRSCFPAGDDIDNAFAFMASTFINRDLFCPDGQVYFMQGGIPSGSVGTSLVGSLVNGLAGNHAMSSISSGHEVGRNSRVNVSGDDTRINSKVPITEEMGDELRDWVSKNLRMELDPPYIFSSCYEKDVERRASFLKTVVVKGRPWRKLSDLWDKLVVGDNLSTRSSEIDYTFARLTNVFLDEGIDRDRVACYFGLINALDLACPADQDSIFEASKTFHSMHSFSEESVRQFLQPYSAVYATFMDRSALMRAALGRWYEQLNFNLKEKRYQNYWEVGKLRMTVHELTSTPRLSYDGDSGHYWNCLIYGTTYYTIRSPPIVL